MDPLTIFTIIVGVVGGVAGVIQIIQYIEQHRGERERIRSTLSTPFLHPSLEENKDDQVILNEVLLLNSEIIGRFLFTREDIIAQVYEKYEPNLSDDIMAAFNELNNRKRNKGLEGYYSGRRFRLIMPPKVNVNTLRLYLAPINYVFTALMIDDDVDLGTKQRVRDEISKSAKKFPRSLVSTDEVFNLISYNLLGIMVCLVTSDGFTLLRRRGTSVLTGRQRWDVSIGGHPVPDDLRDNFLDVARTVQRESENELGVIHGDPRKIVFTGLHRNKISGDIDLLAYWQIENSANQLRSLITDRHPSKNTRIFKTTTKARESYVWDTDNLLTEFNGASIVRGLMEEGTTITNLLPESLACLELALLAQNQPSLSVKI